MNLEQQLADHLEGKFFTCVENDKGGWRVRNILTPPVRISKPIERDWLQVATVPVDHVRVDTIIQATCIAFKFSKNEILSNRRFKPLTTARQVGMWFAKTHTARSLPEIGRRFGGKDHTTVLHAFRKIEDQKEEFMPMISALSEAVRALASQAEKRDNPLLQRAA